MHVNRVLQEMRSQTLITLRSQTLVIRAWNELFRVSEFDPTYLQLERGWLDDASLQPMQVGTGTSDLLASLPLIGDLLADCRFWRKPPPTVRS